MHFLFDTQITEWILMRKSKIQKREIIITIFFIQNRRSGGLFPTSSEFGKDSEGNPM